MKIENRTQFYLGLCLIIIGSVFACLLNSVVLFVLCALLSLFPLSAGIEIDRLEKGRGER